MNKKFFTLLAAAALLVGGTANAQVGAPVEKLNEGDNAGSFVLHDFNTVGDFLYLSNPSSTGESTFFVGDTATLSDNNANFLNSLWCVNVDNPVASLYPQFTFTNKGAQGYLEIDLAPLYAASPDSLFPATTGVGDVYLWKFSSKFKNSLDEKAYLASYINSDIIAVLVRETGTNNVYVAVTKAPEGTVLPTVPSGYTVIEFTLAYAAERQLTAEEFNTVLYTQPSGIRTLKFSPDNNKTSQVNPFSKTGVKAEDATVADYLNFKKGDDKKDYLRVDTAYINSQGVEFLGFAFDSIVPALQGQYDFKVFYYPSNDSLTIQVREARYKTAAETSWISASDVRNDQFVSVQDLVKADQIRIVTVFEKQNTHIGFGIGGCSVEDNKITIDEDLYLIKNGNKYLAAPIYKSSDASETGDTNIPTWVDLTDAKIDPTHEPAFQWLVTKVRSNDPLGKSPVKIQNREYSSVGYTSLQLVEGANNTFDGTKIDVTTAFIGLPDSIKSNKRLGYKDITLDNEDWKVKRYVFEYLHNFNSTEYLGVTSSSTDSFLYIKSGDNKTKFTLIPQNTAKYTTYGAYVKRTEANSKLAKLAQLERMSYVLRVNDANKLTQNNKYVVADQENLRYTVSDYSNNAAIFFLKENNYADGKNYYALVDTFSIGTHASQHDYSIIKVGIDDASLHAKVNQYNETRTSAFAVVLDTDPLYRRFNDGNLNESNGNDTADTLVFFRTNEPSDVLYENAHLITGEYGKADTSINFLGVRNQDLLAQDGIKRNLGFLVDTAYVNRGTGYIKPQYLISVRNVTIPDGDPECGSCGWTQKPGYTYGWYLVNATDSARVDGSKPSKDAAPKDIKNEDYIWNTKWDRLVFVEAIRKKDSLYVLNGFKPSYDKNGYVDFDELIASKVVEKVALNDNKHKDVVWQFRLIDDKAARDFLIESENETPGAKAPAGNGTIIAPFQGGWIKIQNGVPVISRGAYTDAITEAEIFNVRATKDAPVGNEDINTTEVTVVAGAGQVTIYNAAGKQVVISNILGQSVANTVITSDAQTISAPKGVVVVAIQGEKAVKAVVK